MIEEGKLAPNVELTLPDGVKNLDSFKGKNLVLYFYPKDDTPGCTTEAKDFAALTNHFAELNTTIIGISRDDLKKHQKFAEKHCLNFPLASDLEGKITELFGVWVEKSMYGKKYMGIERSTFLIDQQGVIRKIWRKVSVTGHAQEVYHTLQGIVNE